MKAGWRRRALKLMVVVLVDVGVVIQMARSALVRLECAGTRRLCLVHLLCMDVEVVLNPPFAIVEAARGHLLCKNFCVVVDLHLDMHCCIC